MGILKRNGLAIVVGVLAAIGFSVLCFEAGKRFGTWVPEKGAPYSFRVGESEVPAIQISPEGILVINIPAVMKEWKAAPKPKPQEKK